MHLEKTPLPTRRSRAAYIVKRFKKYFCGEVLDIGYDEAHLKMLLPYLSYTKFNNSKELGYKDWKLPFEDKNFDCILFSDLFEHVDHLDEIFHELLRVSRRYVLISFPNHLSDTRLPIVEGEGALIHDGQAMTKLPQRTLNVCDIVNFIESHAKRYPFKIVEMFTTDKPRALLAQMIRKIDTLSKKTRRNRTTNTLWTVIEISP